MRESLLLQLDALYRFILVRVGFDEAAADDLLQQTAETALRADPAAMAAVESLEGWLRGVARNLVRRHWRDRATRDPHAHPRVGDGLRVLAALESGCPAEALAERELRVALLWAIASLPAGDQWLLYAVYRYGKSRPQVASELGCSAKGIEMRLYRARERLREALARCGEDE
ncbi:MAG TPA: sigma-70 family RNA polymerase sigma factor [Phycisphaerales bacterium]|nr:sigma-70 family RNA polymerase sigma factor [Phycisphaerales bacterium]